MTWREAQVAMIQEIKLLAESISTDTPQPLTVNTIARMIE